MNWSRGDRVALVEAMPILVAVVQAEVNLEDLSEALQTMGLSEALADIVRGEIARDG